MLTIIIIYYKAAGLMLDDGHHDHHHFEWNELVSMIEKSFQKSNQKTMTFSIFFFWKKKINDVFVCIFLFFLNLAHADVMDDD